MGIIIFLLFLFFALMTKAYTWDGLASPISWGMVVLFGLAFIGQSALEEVVFRGFLLHFLARRRSKLFGIILSSAIFALLHLPGKEATPLAFIDIFLIALVFCLLTFKTGSLLAASGFHFSWNYLQMVIFNTPNARDQITTQVFYTDYLSQEASLTGGTYGPEGSILSTLIFAFLIVALLMWDKGGLSLKDPLPKI